MKKIMFRMGLIVVFSLFAFIWVQQEMMMATVKEKTAKQQAIYEETLNYNEKLTNTLDSADTKEFYVEQARSRLDYYRPGEIPVKNKSNED